MDSKSELLAILATIIYACEKNAQVYSTASTAQAVDRAQEIMEQAFAKGNLK